MEKDIVIKYSVIVVIILTVVFLSQQPFFSGMGRNLSSKGSAAISAYMAKGSNWVGANLLSKLGGDVQKGGETIKTGVDQGKENISQGSQNISDKVKNYLTGVADSVAGKTQTPNCLPATSSKAVK